jgi:uncharacterized protein YdeI (YjbR/CyaY-like superfamily)
LRGDERRGRFLRFRATLAPGSFRFERFALDPQDRQLTRDNAPVALNTRYLDALTLLVREHGKLVSKDRFLAEVWAGTPVTDEALTQCVRTLRKRWATTPPGRASSPPCPSTATASSRRSSGSTMSRRPATATAVEGPPSPGLFAGQRLLWLGGPGWSAAARPGRWADCSTAWPARPVAARRDGGAVGAAGPGLRHPAAGPGRRRRRRLRRRGDELAVRPLGPWSLAGGAAGGLLVGAIVKLLGLDAFELLLGRSPGDITGAPEGALLGGAVGLGGLAGGRLSLRRGVAVAGLAGAGGGALITVLGGRLLGGSLDLLVRHFPGARLRLDPIGGLLGESGFRAAQPGRHQRPGRRAVRRRRGRGDDHGSTKDPFLMAAVHVDPAHVHEFVDAEAFNAWLAQHHDQQSEVWIKIHKVGSRLPSITPKQAIDVVLCWGWIDAVRKGFDEQSFLQRYTPRGKKSIWSQINVDNVARLTQEGRMTPRGQSEIDAAKADGRWARAYGGSRDMKIPDALQAAIDASPKAKAMLATLSAQNRFALAFRVHNLKTEAGRQKRIAAFVEMLERGETIYPQGKR